MLYFYTFYIFVLCHFCCTFFHNHSAAPATYPTDNPTRGIQLGGSSDSGSSDQGNNQECEQQQQQQQEKQSQPQQRPDGDGHGDSDGYRDGDGATAVTNLTLEEDLNSIYVPSTHEYTFNNRWNRREREW